MTVLVKEVYKANIEFELLNESIECTARIHIDHVGARIEFFASGKATFPRKHFHVFHSRHRRRFRLCNWGKYIAHDSVRTFQMPATYNILETYNGQKLSRAQNPVV